MYAKKLLLLFNPREGAAASLVSFTNREKDVLKYISEGLSNQEIADLLFLTLGTSKKYVHTIFQKLEVKNRVQAAKKARQMEL
ncbi:response regulator transcription factor [Brevibacillus nitrificans]|uniref:response regulator transcription factor n=1 Tax=Brevibacillus nitrificans TaxID=651560 RepID=UPI0026330357|nr:response regulator transcription factor [Brevibacillus nitrificans]